MGPGTRLSPRPIGHLTVKSAKTRTGSSFPSLLTPRRDIDVELHAQGDGGLPGRGVDPQQSTTWSPRLGTESGICKSEVYRICAELDTDGTAFNTRELGE